MRLLVLASVLSLAAVAACAPDGADPPAPQAEAREQSAAGVVARFSAPHPLAEAQALEAAGRCVEAERLARATLAERTELAGLCFDRFTLGGAEIVLKSCAPLAAADAEAFQRDWAARLGAMEGVEYAEPNLIAAATGCP